MQRKKTEPTEWVVAFAGNGTVTQENVEDLLNNWIGDNPVKEFIVPDKIAARKQKGLQVVADYLTEEWEEFNSMPVADMAGYLTTARDAGQAAYLVVIVGDDAADDETAELVSDSIVAGITVKDLAAGLDDIEGTGGEEPVEAPEPEPAAPAKRRRANARSEKAEPEEAPEAPRQRGRPRTTGEVAGIGEKALDSLAEIRNRVSAKDDSVPFEVVPSPAGYVEASFLAAEAAYRKVLGVALRGALVALEFDGPPAREAFPEGGATSPAKTAGPTAAYIKSADGTLRKRGRGKPRADEEAVYLTDDQARDQGFEF